MTLWIILALMTGLAVFAVLWPLSRKTRIQQSSGDIAVYRDQLDEIERDRAAGLIGLPEAEAARIEVSRRLLAAAEAVAQDKPQADGGRRRRVAALVALVGVPLSAIAIYLSIGAPGLPGQPLAARLSAPPENRSIETLVAQVEAHLERNPTDARGWEVLAPVYMRLGRFADAVKARRNALRLDAPTAGREADLGEALTAQANGVVTAEARAAFDRALALDRKDFRARFFSGLAAEQDGQRTRAASIWRQLIEDAPHDAGWIDYVRQALARVEDAPSVAATMSPKPEDYAAAAELSDEQRKDMARGMVERLAERLKRDGADVDGWARLVRSYAVLGEPEKARSAALDARRALEGDPAKMRRFDELLKDSRF